MVICSQLPLVVPVRLTAAPLLSTVTTEVDVLGPLRTFSASVATADAGEVVAVIGVDRSELTR